MKQSMIVAMSSMVLMLQMTVALSTAGKGVMLMNRIGPASADLFVANGDGSGERRLLQRPGFDYDASFSPDGQWIVFTSERAGAGQADIYRVRRNGSGLERLTDGPAMDDQAALSPGGTALATEWGNVPSWSPSGDRILFTRQRATDQDFDIYTIKPDGSDLRQVTRSPGTDGHATWTADGTQIFVASARTGVQGRGRALRHLPAAVRPDHGVHG